MQNYPYRNVPRPYREASKHPLHLIRCPGCKKNITSDHDVCPECGFDLKSDACVRLNKAEERKNRRLIALIGLIILCAALLAGYLLIKYPPVSALYR